MAGSHEPCGQAAVAGSVPSALLPQHMRSQARLCDLPLSSPDSSALVLVYLRGTHSDTPFAGCQVTAAGCCVSPCAAAPMPLNLPVTLQLCLCVCLLFYS